MASDPAGGSYLGLQLGRRLAGLPQSGSLDPARRLIDKLRPAVRGDAVGLPAPPAGAVSTGQSRQLAPAETVHVIAQVERVLDAEVASQNAATSATVVASGGAAAVQPKGKPMSITGASYLGQSAQDRVKAAKAKIAAAQGKMDGAFAQLDTATTTVEAVATTIEQEANDLAASVHGLTNG
jgi:hypothetical protein